ncbi:MAG: hypothetical protein HWD61_11755 [Parachlamydiaceae bacterium]|nr:MAG: hypothetical protein HWD61_11755 [Parachlamydiaceae bacterium]
MQLLEQEHRVLIAENQENKAALLQKNLEIEEIEKLKNLVAAYKKEHSNHPCAL